MFIVLKKMFKQNSWVLCKQYEDRDDEDEIFLDKYKQLTLRLYSMITYLLKSRSLFFIAWFKRRGVDTRISQCISLKFPSCERSLVISLIENFLPFANFLHSLVVCAANSLVGQRITALTAPLDPGY
jgi:hypothetical protein